MTIREKNLNELADRPMDMLVVGGGIVGAGVARDAAMRGLRVGVIDRHDFAFGTSSRSSRLLHGGLRYLAQGRIGLVREAGREKAILARIAPHLASPLAFVFPSYQGADWPRWQLSVGVRIYDLLCGVDQGPRSGTMSRDRVLEHIPLLRREGLTGAVRYGDALTNDARLVLDTLMSAAEHGATVINYLALKSARRVGDVWACQLEDIHGAGTLEVGARTLVNAAGPWAGIFPQSGLQLRLTKGVHLVVDRARLDICDAVVMAEGKRILFAIPLGQRIILGTTDTDYSGDADAVRADDADVEYILGVVNGAFPDAHLSAEEIISDWAGLRPLIAKGDGSPSDISRKHLILEPEAGWIDVAGGKLTTHRHIAQEVVDRAIRAAGLRAGPCRTHLEPLLPAESAAMVSAITPLAPTPQLIEHFCAKEWALHLEDVMSRRGRWDTYEADAPQIALQVAQVMAGSLGWTQERRLAELARWRARSSRFLRFPADFPGG